MKSNLRNKPSLKDAWMINLALMLFVSTITISKPSFVTASGDASSFWVPQNYTTETDFENETSDESTSLSSSPTQTPTSESTSSTTNEQTTNTSEPTTTTSEPTTTTYEPTTTASEPTTATSEPTTTASEPTTATSEPTTNTSDPTTTTSKPTTTSPEGPPDQPGNLGVIIGGAVGACLLLIMVAVLFVYRKPLMGYCSIGRHNGVRHPAFAPYVPQDQETSEPENSGTSSTLDSILEEFKELSSYNPAITSSIAHLEKNAPENRYRDAVPYDFNIVSLKSGNYVNASHMDSNIIMTQDPIMTQVDDFWQMVWEHNVSIIVRLSNDHDGKFLPSEYIPRRRGVFGQLDVTNVGELHRINYSRRIFRLNDTTSTVKNRVREIYHYHLCGWETDSLPPLRDFMVALQDIRKQKKICDQMGLIRILVHCGSGSGRTGAFVAVWLLLDSVDAEETDISVSKTVKRLREQRANVVNKLELYKFIHKCLDFYRTSVDTPPSESPYETRVVVDNSGSSGTDSRQASTTTT